MTRFHASLAAFGLFLAAFSPLFSQPVPDFFDARKQFTSLRFEFSKPENEVLKSLFDDASLAQVFNEFDTPLQKAEALTHFAHGLFSSEKGTEKAETDPTAILRAARKGEKLGLESRAVLLAALLNSAGLPSRKLAMHNEKGKKRWAVEVFLADKNGWALCDAEADFIPSDFGRPLSAAELLAAIEADKFVYNSIDQSTAKSEDFRKKVEPFLAAFSAQTDCRYGAERGQKASPTLVLLPKTADKAAFLKKANLEGEVEATTSTDDFYPKPSGF